MKRGKKEEIIRNKMKEKKKDVKVDWKPDRQDTRRGSNGFIFQ
jgi:hypothetical protein